MRKLYLLSTLLIVFCSSSIGQKSKTSISLANYRSNSTNLKSKSDELGKSLGTTLKLKEMQQTRVSKLVYLLSIQKDKANAMDMNSKAAAVKIALVNFDTGMKNLVTKPQYASFQALRPAASDPSNRYNSLFY